MTHFVRILNDRKYAVAQLMHCVWKSQVTEDAMANLNNNR